MNTPIVQANPVPASLMADLLAFICGLITSLLTGVLLWFVTVKLHFAIHKMTVWFLFPLGAFLAGWAAASGYFLAYQMYQRRPGKLLAPNVTAAAVASFLLIYYLTYLTFQNSPGRLDPTMSFLSFLDLSIRSTTFRVVSLASTPRLGYFGYVTTALEVCGFAIGGVAVWALLRSKSYCDRCFWRLKLKGKQVRYTSQSEEMQSMAMAMTDMIKQGDVARAVKQYAACGTFARYPNSSIRSVCTVYACRHCGRHTAVFELQRPQGNGWIPIRDSVTLAHSDSPVDIVRLLTSGN